MGSVPAIFRDFAPGGRTRGSTRRSPRRPPARRSRCSCRAASRSPGGVRGRGRGRWPSDSCVFGPAREVRRCAPRRRQRGGRRGSEAPGEGGRERERTRAAVSKRWRRAELWLAVSWARPRRRRELLSSSCATASRICGCGAPGRAQGMRQEARRPAGRAEGLAAGARSGPGQRQASLLLDWAVRHAGGPGSGLNRTARGRRAGLTRRRGRRASGLRAWLKSSVVPVMSECP